VIDEAKGVQRPHMLLARDLQKAFNAWVNLLCKVLLDDYHLKWLVYKKSKVIIDNNYGKFVERI
jgi:hypothetical protein